jgi:hypothetical protein
MALASTRTLIDVEVDVDHLAGDRRAGGEQRDLLRFAGPAVDDRAAGEPAHEADGARFDVAQKRRDDHRQHDEHTEDDRGDENERVHTWKGKR